VARFGRKQAPAVVVKLVRFGRSDIVENLLIPVAYASGSEPTDVSVLRKSFNLESVQDNEKTT
jgi:hypothetical protein